MDFTDGKTPYDILELANGPAATDAEIRKVCMHSSRPLQLLMPREGGASHTRSSAAATPLRLLNAGPPWRGGCPTGFAQLGGPTAQAQRCGRGGHGPTHPRRALALH